MMKLLKQLKPGQILRMLWHNISDFVERILKKILPVIRKETIKRLLVWIGWILMLVAEAVIESAE